MMPTEKKPFLPLRQTLRILPLADLGITLDGEFLDVLGIEHFDIELNEGEEYVKIDTTISFIDEIVLEVPNANGLALVFNSDRGRASFPSHIMFGSRSEIAIQKFQFKIRIT